MLDSTVAPAALAVDEAAAIRAVIARAHQAWAKGDGRSYATCFTAETGDTAFFGLCRDGRAANAELHGALFQCAAKGAAIDARIEALEWLSDDVALVRTASFGATSGYQTYVMVRRAGAWRIRSFQHTPVSPLASGIARWARRRGAPISPALSSRP